MTPSAVAPATSRTGTARGEDAETLCKPHEDPDEVRGDRCRDTPAPRPCAGRQNSRAASHERPADCVTGPAGLDDASGSSMASSQHQPRIPPFRNLHHQRSTGGGEPALGGTWTCAQTASRGRGGRSMQRPCVVSAPRRSRPPPDTAPASDGLSRRGATGAVLMAGSAATHGFDIVVELNEFALTTGLRASGRSRPRLSPAAAARRGRSGHADAHLPGAVGLP